jgi:HAD superfamily hydrolase (TIGR01509 family)
MTIQYVFWDSDNTLVDTATHHWRKHFETLKAHGIHLDEKWQNRIYTNNGAQNWEWLTAELGLKMQQQDYLDEIDGWYFRHIDSIALRDGIPEALSLFEQAGLPMCVVSNGRRRSVISALEAKNLVPHFKFILCKEDYQGRKPEPGPYLAAKTRMQQMVGKDIDPQTCLVIEDDPKGVESGRTAGMQVLHREINDSDTRAFLENCRRLIKS